MAEPNDELRRARERIESPAVPGEPLSRQELAELVNAWIFDHCDRRVVELDATYIGKLERGVIRWPQHPERRAAFRAVLNVNTDCELGFRRPRRSRRTVTIVDRQQFLRAALGIGAGTVVGSPLADLITSIEPPRVPSVVGRHEIDQVRSANEVFETSDRIYGGGVLRHAIVAQLRHAAELLNAHCPERLRPELFSAVGALACTAGFMAFDINAHNDAQRLYQFALACVDEAGDWHLRADVLHNVALQAYWLGDYDGGLTHLDLAMVRSDRLTAAGRALLHTGRALALAGLGRTPEARTAVGMADDEFNHSDPADEPWNLHWYDTAMHHGSTGQALATFARRGRFTDDASTRLSTAIITHGDDATRPRALAQINLAALTMTAGDPREAATIGIQATDAASTIRSGRIADTLRELRQLAAPHMKIPEVADLRHRIGSAV